MQTSRCKKWRGHFRQQVVTDSAVVKLEHAAVLHLCRQQQTGDFYLTYSLLVRDVQLWFLVGLQFVLLESCIDPSILHDLLQEQSEKIKSGCVTVSKFFQD